MPGPTFVFAFVIATLTGAIFHLFVGGTARRLALLLLSAWIGFALGHIAGQALGVELFSIGSLRIIPAEIGAIFTMIGALILTSDKNEPLRR